MDCFPPPHKHEITSCILNKTTPLAKIKSPTEAASAYLGLLCTTVLAINCRVSVAGGCKGDMRQEVANCPVLVKTGFSLHWNWCKWSIACQNFSQKCAQCLCLNIFKKEWQLLARGVGGHIRRYSWGRNACRETAELLLGKHMEKTLRTCIETYSQRNTLHAWGDSLWRALWPKGKPCQSRDSSEVTKARTRPKLEQAHLWKGLWPCVTMNSDTDQPRAAEDTHPNDKGQTSQYAYEPNLLCDLSPQACNSQWKQGKLTRTAGRRGVRFKLSLRKGESRCFVKCLSNFLLSFLPNTWISD